MKLEKIFEKIYKECNPSSKGKFNSRYLRESELVKLFEQVLREAHLREMGIFDKSRVAKSLNNLLKLAREAFDGFAKSIRDKNNFTAIHNKENNHIENTVSKLIEMGDTEDQPFRIKKSDNTIIDQNINNFKDELDGWTEDMVKLLPKDEGNSDRCHGFSLTNIKNAFIKKYKEFLGVQ